MKKTCVNHSGRIPHRDVEDRFSRAREAHRAAPASYLHENGVNLTWNNLGNGRETNAIFVTEGKVTEQVADGQDPALFKNRGSMRADAAQIFYRVVESDRHLGLAARRRGEPPYFYTICSIPNFIVGPRSLDYFGGGGAM